MVIVVVMALRFVVPLTIPRFPLPAIVACLVIDAVDQTVFQMVTDDPLAWYQTYDKALDIFYLAIAYFSAMRNWRDPVAFEVARFLYLYRLVGVVLFEAFDARWMLLVFPNTFEYFFIAYEAVRTRWNPLRLGLRSVVGLAATIWIVIKLPQEWWIHVAKLDVTDFVADHPLVGLAVAAVAVVAGVVLWGRRSSLPEPDWAFTVRVDDHLPSLPQRSELPERFISWIFFEKFVLMMLISAIFANVLPGIEATSAGLIGGVTALVLSNTLVSQLVRRWRGRTWGSTVTQVLGTFAINVGLTFLDSAVGPDRRADTPQAVTIFFVVLLSLMIGLFDRFRGTRPPDERIDLTKLTIRTFRKRPPFADEPRAAT